MEDRTVAVLKEMFGSVADDETICRISTYYNGSLTPSIEALMKITNTEEFSINGNTVSVDTSALNPDIAPDINMRQENGSKRYLSYKSAFQSCQESDKLKASYSGAPQGSAGNALNVYSNKRDIEEVCRQVNAGFKVLVLMRGLPGAGKSTLAKTVVNLTVQSNCGHVFSSDDFFYSRNKYVYQRERLGEAHQWNQRRVIDALSKGVSPVIVDNTNLELWEMHVYVCNGVLNGYMIHVLEAQTPWAHKPGELARKSVHGVPTDKIKRMSEKYHSNISGDYLLDYFKLEYKQGNLPPQQRLIPPLKRTTHSTSHQGLRMATETSIGGPSGSPVFTFKSNSSPSTSNHVGKYRFDSKPQREAGGPRRNGLLNQFSDMSEWKPIDDWETLETEPPPQPDSAIAVEVDKSYAHNEVATQTSNMSAEELSTCKQLVAVSRAINVSANHLVIVNTYKKLMLDKGVMTDEELSAANSLTTKDKLEGLKALFNHIPHKYLGYILERCNGDTNWACDILLDSNTDLGNYMMDCDGTEEDEEQTACQEEPPGTPDSVEDAETSSTHSKDESDCSAGSNDSQTKKKRSTKDSPDMMILKKQIEDNFVIADDYYSEHVLKLRKKIHPNPNQDVETATPSTSRNIDLPDEDTAATPQDCEDHEDQCAEEPTESVSVRVGHDFIGELNKIYKAPYYDSSLEPVIHMPLSLLNQIQALWLESMCNQIDVQKENMKAIVTQDEEFARQLIEQENAEEDRGETGEVPNLKQIMEMEMDLVRYNMAQSEWKKETRDDLATKLTRQKLIKLFPNVDEHILMELLHAYNYNFDMAFEDLLLSTGKVSKSQSYTIDQKDLHRILAEQEKDLIERSIKEKEKQFSIPVDLQPSTSASGDPQRTRESVELYRQEARDLLSLRNSHYAKAQEYINKKMYGSASYYSNLANLCSKKHDYISTIAASEIVQMNTKEQNTLDLHTFYVKEAVQFLDLYLDKHIRALREKYSKPYSVKLFLITGRGSHSPGQQAKIKPAVKKRLTERKLKYLEVNPGLLSVVVSVHDDLTDFMK